MKKSEKKSPKKSVKKAVVEIERLTWHGALKFVRNRVFKIRTPRGHGTGFHIGNFGVGNKLSAIVTANHVIDSADDWNEPMKIIHEVSGKESLLKEEERVIFSFSPKSDLAIILFKRSDDLPVPASEIEYLRPDQSLFPGVEVGWCGFPSTGSGELGFFHGYVSSLMSDGYLIDGVAINGVSGGPAFFIDRETNLPVVLGVISAYIANRNTGEALPGVSMVSAIPDEYEKRIVSFRNLGNAAKEAKKQSEEAE